MIILLRTEKKQQNLISVQVIVGRIDGSLINIFVSHFASPDSRSVSGKPRALHNVVSAGNDSNCAFVPDMEPTGERIAQRSGDIFTRTEKVEIRETQNVGRIFAEQ